jgi:hypothetical protein
LLGQSELHCAAVTNKRNAALVGVVKRRFGYLRNAVVLDAGHNYGLPKIVGLCIL